MLSKKLVILILAFIGSHSFSSESLPGQLSLEDIKLGLKNRAILLSNTEVDFKYKAYGKRVESSNPDSSFLGLSEHTIHNANLKRSENKMRFERKSVSPESGENTRFELYTWNEKISTGFMEQYSSSRPRGMVQAKRVNSFDVGYWLTPLEQGVFDYHKPLAEIVEENDWNLLGSEMVGLYSAYKLKCKSVYNDNNIEMTLWIDPIRDFAPVKIELVIEFEDGEKVIEKMENISLEKIDGVWVISNAMMTIKNPFLWDAPDVQGAMLFTVEKYKIGVEFSDEIFQQTFPQGTIVYDDFLKMGYIVGEGLLGEKRGIELLDTELNKQNEVMRNTNHLSKPNSPDNTPDAGKQNLENDLSSKLFSYNEPEVKYRKFLLVFILIFAVLLAIFFYHHWRNNGLHRE